MSVVIGLITNDGRTLVAFDQLVSDDYVARAGTQQKAFHLPVKDANGRTQFKMIFGVVGVPAVNSTIRYNFTPPPYTPCVISTPLLDEYVYGSLIPSIAQTEKTRASHWGLEPSVFGLLIAARKHIWTVDAYHNAVRFERNFDAVGSGAYVALGALYALQTTNKGKLGRSDLSTAIDSVINLDMGCGGEVEILEVE